MSVQTDFEKLIYTLNLSPYQARQIYSRRDEYDVSRLEMRGPVLYAPHKCNLLQRIMCRRRGDVIGARRMFMQGARNVRLCAGGYHMGRVGRSVIYGDPDGRAILRDAFNDRAK